MICVVYCCLRRVFFCCNEMVAAQLYDMCGVLLFENGVFLLFEMVAAQLYDMCGVLLFEK